MHTRPDQFELWADLQKQNRHLRRFGYVLAGTVVLLVVALVLTSFRPMMAIRVDSLGQAELVQVLAPSNAPAPEEAEHVSRLLAQYLLEVTSNSVARDLSHAYSFMTADFARAYAAKVKEDPNLAVLEKGNIRSQLTWEPKGTRVKAEKDDAGKPLRYFVELEGTVEVYRADILTSPLLTTNVLVRTTLLVVPRSPATLNGLLVDYFEKEYVKPKETEPSGISTSPFPSPAQVKP
ncbi:hypothetical protein [Myxococcus vastator]|uniref:hypothetical protein n=1 Tax=Myxococcus vastator TaxID=2709664 RepID=UPI0013D10BFD|nr:hypothetical protein [Myxococcus vastator]